MRINIKRLLTNTDSLSIIDSLAGNEEFAILNHQGKLVYGSDNHKTIAVHEVEVRVNDVYIALVKSSNSRKAGVIAKYISLLANLEYEKKALAAEALEKYKEISLMSELNAKLGAVLRPLDVANTLIKELEKVLWADHIQIVIYDHEKKQFENLATMNKEALPPWQDTKLATKWLSSNIAGEIINNVPADTRFSELVPPVTSMMAAPLTIHNQTTGGVFVFSRQFHNYTSMDLKLLSALTAQTATALEAARLYELLMESFVTTVFTLVETLEKRDPYTGGHTRRVMEYSIKIGEKLGFSREAMEQLRFAAVLHDIGKIGIRDSVLLKNSKLTDEEYAIIQKHTIYGEEILSKIRALRHLIPGVKHHHERYDGKGYPDGQKANAINLHARIIAVADAFDAMTSDRPYRKKMDVTTACDW